MNSIYKFIASQPALARRQRNIIMLCKDYGIHSYKPTLSKPGLGQGSGPGTQRENEYKLNNGVFSLMSVGLINFNVPRINAPEAH
jgi:hypothetical protein